MHRLLSIVLIGLLLSCSILEDSDITSYDELKHLRLKGITFTQVLNSGTYTRGIPAIDSVLNITFALGKLTKQTRLNWGNVDANSKFKFASGATSNISIVNRYFDNGNLRSSWVYSGSTIREMYYFTYNSNKTIQTLARTLYTDPNDLTKKTTSYDTIFYDSNSKFFGFAIRSSFDATKRGVFGIEPISTNPCDIVWVFKRSANANLGIPATEKEYDYCGPTDFYIYPGGQSADFHSLGSDVLEEFYIGDRMTDSDKKCCADRYYYHPILFLPVDFRYKVMYAVDWWEEVTPTSSSPKTESVQFTFLYEP
jgi:hypothetical protein